MKASLRTLGIAGSNSESGLFWVGKGAGPKSRGLEKGSGPKSAKHPKGRSGFWGLTPFPNPES